MSAQYSKIQLTNRILIAKKSFKLREFMSKKRILLRPGALVPGSACLKIYCNGASGEDSG
jgi:hypothetical protein